MGTFRQRLDRLLARDHSGVGAKGRTAAYVHAQRRPRAVVLLHGMSSSPPQFARYAAALFERGHNVIVPRLPAHGHADRLSTALARLRPDDLYSAVDDYLGVASELGERVTVAGFSLGGLLAAWCAQHYAIERAVAIAPFFGVAWIPGSVMPLLGEALLRVPNRFAWWNPFLRDRQRPDHGYPRYATHAIAHAHRMARELLRESGERGPSARRVVLVANAREAAVDNRAIRRLYERWHLRSPDAVELVALTGLPLSHDIVEPQRRGDLAARAFPQLLAAIDPKP